MSGVHSKELFNEDQLTVSKLIGKKKSNLSAVIKAFTISAVAVVLVFSIIVTVFFLKDISHKKILEDAKNVIKTSGGMENALKVLANENPDISSWITIADTQIDCAVCTAADDYYKNHNQKRKPSRYGALFMTDGDTPQRAGGDKNIVIYGNNMPNGSMFGGLKEYRKLKFYKENPKIFFYFGDKKQQYFIFAVALIDGETNDFDYKKSKFSSEKEFDEWYSEIEKRSIIDTSVTPTKDDEFLTLVTDMDDFSGARLIVMARLADEWDFVLTDLENAKVNADAIYPEKWYNR